MAQLALSRGELDKARFTLLELESVTRAIGDNWDLAWTLSDLAQIGLMRGEFAAAKKYALPEELLLAVITVESQFNPNALSEKGAMGLMQLMPGTAREMYVDDAWAPAQNIDGGARYLRILANMYGGAVVRTVAAYNAGPEAVRRAGDTVPNIPETREYVRRVVALYETFRAGK